MYLIVHGTQISHEFESRPNGGMTLPNRTGAMFPDPPCDVLELCDPHAWKQSHNVSTPSNWIIASEIVLSTPSLPKTSSAINMRSRLSSHEAVSSLTGTLFNLRVHQPLKAHTCSIAKCDASLNGDSTKLAILSDGKWQCQQLCSADAQGCEECVMSRRSFECLKTEISTREQ